MLNSFSVGCGNSNLWPWQYPLFVVAVSIFLWQHTFGLGSIHLLLLLLLQYPLFVVAGQVFCSMWCVVGASLGVIFKPYPVTTSQQRIMLEQTAKSIGEFLPTGNPHSIALILGASGVLVHNRLCVRLHIAHVGVPQKDWNVVPGCYRWCLPKKNKSLTVLSYLGGAM